MRPFFARDGLPLAPDQTLASNVTANNFQDVQNFLKNGGQRVQQDLDADGIYAQVLYPSVTLAGARRKIETEFGLKPTPAVHPDKLLKALWQVRDELQEIARTLGPRAKKTDFFPRVLL